MHAMAAVYALFHGLAVVLLVRRHIEDDIGARLVESDRVGRGEYAIIAHGDSCWMGDTVTVDRHIVHHIDIENPVAEIVCNALCCSSHRLEESILVADILPHALDSLLLPCRVYIGLAVCRGYSDALVLQRSSQSAHRVALEVGEVDEEGISLQVAADNVVSQVCGVADSDAYLSLSIHDVNGRDSCESMLLGHTHMLLSGAALPSVGCVTLDDSAVDKLDKGSYQLWLEIVGVSRLASAYLYCHFPLCSAPQGFVYTYERLGRYLACDIDFWLLCHGCQAYHG